MVRTEKKLLEHYCNTSLSIISNALRFFFGLRTLIGRHLFRVLVIVHDNMIILVIIFSVKDSL